MRWSRCWSPGSQPDGQSYLAQRDTLSLAGVYTGLDIQLTTSDKAMHAMLAAGAWQETEFADLRGKKTGRGPEKESDSDELKTTPKERTKLR